MNINVNSRSNKIILTLGHLVPGYFGLFAALFISFAVFSGHALNGAIPTDCASSSVDCISEISKIKFYFIGLLVIWGPLLFLYLFSISCSKENGERLKHAEVLRFNLSWRIFLTGILLAFLILWEFRATLLEQSKLSEVVIAMLLLCPVLPLLLIAILLQVSPLLAVYSLWKGRSFKYFLLTIFR